MFNSIASIDEHVSFIQAAHHPGWQEAMDKEHTFLSLSNTWYVVVLPSDKKVLPSK